MNLSGGKKNNAAGARRNKREMDDIGDRRNIDVKQSAGLRRRSITRLRWLARLCERARVSRAGSCDDEVWISALAGQSECGIGFIVAVDEDAAAAAAAA